VRERNESQALGGGAVAIRRRKRRPESWDRGPSSVAILVNGSGFPALRRPIVKCNLLTSRSAAGGVPKPLVSRSPRSVIEDLRGPRNGVWHPRSCHPKSRARRGVGTVLSRSANRQVAARSPASVSNLKVMFPPDVASITGTFHDHWSRDDRSALWLKDVPVKVPPTHCPKEWHDSQVKFKLSRWRVQFVSSDSPSSGKKRQAVEDPGTPPQRPLGTASLARGVSPERGKRFW